MHEFKTIFNYVNNPLFLVIQLKTVLGGIVTEPVTLCDWHCNSVTASVTISSSAVFMKNKEVFT
jgi:hypothetical protein